MESSINENSWKELERIHKEIFPEPEKEENWDGKNLIQLKYIRAFEIGY